MRPVLVCCGGPKTGEISSSRGISYLGSSTKRLFSWSGVNEYGDKSVGRITQAHSLGPAPDRTGGGTTAGSGVSWVILLSMD